MRQIYMVEGGFIWMKDTCSACQGNGKTYKMFKIFSSQCLPCKGTGKKEFAQGEVTVQGAKFDAAKIENMIRDAENYLLERKGQKDGAIYFGDKYKLVFRRSRVRDDIFNGLTYLMNMVEIHQSIIKQLGNPNVTKLAPKK